MSRSLLLRMAICLVVIFPFAQLTAQDQCVALLRHGIYNTVRTSQSDSSAATLYNQLCANYNSYKAGTLKADASGSYDLISGSASLSKSDVESIGQAMCSTNYSNNQAVSDLSNFSSMVDHEGLEAFNECIKNSSVNLIVNTDYDETTPEAVTISAHYSPLGTPVKQYVTGFNLTDSSTNPSLKVACSGTLYDAALHHAELSSSVLTMQCRRPAENDPTKAFHILGSPSLGLAFPAKVSISTSVGAIIFSWSAIYLPAPPSPLPTAYVGEIRSVAFATDSPGYSALTTTGWLECAGQVLNASDYPELYKALGNTWGTANLGSTFKLPDLRGQFLRGWNHGAGVDPDAAQRNAADPGNSHPGWTGAAGDAVGSRQDGSIQNHSHAIRQVPQISSFTQGDSGQGSHMGETSSIGGYRTETDGGGAETRPKNIAVLYLIYTGKRP